MAARAASSVENETNPQPGTADQKATVEGTVSVRPPIRRAVGRCRGVRASAGTAGRGHRPLFGTAAARRSAAHAVGGDECTFRQVGCLVVDDGDLLDVAKWLKSWPQFGHISFGQNFTFKSTNSRLTHFSAAE